MKVPLNDLRLQYQSIREEIDGAIQNVFESCAFSGGPFVAEFERNFSQFCQTGQTVGVGNGTEALWLALLALGIGPGDEVITVPNTFIATAEAISYTGATPRFTDIDKLSYTIDPGSIEKALTRRTKAIIPVHLYGQMADMDPIMEIARSHGLRVIEDASQAHGAHYRGRPAGSIGDAGCFSFYPGKNLGACGEGGAVTTSRPDVAERLRLLRDHGQRTKYDHQIIGFNARMDGLQGAILNVKLGHLRKWNERRRSIAHRYTQLLGNTEGITTPWEADYGHHVFHVYAVQVERRDTVLDVLRGRDIHCGIHYPLPIHLQDAYRKGSEINTRLPVAETIAPKLLSLPIFPEMEEAQVDHVASQLLAVVRGKRLSATGAFRGREQVGENPVQPCP